MPKVTFKKAYGHEKTIRFKRMSLSDITLEMNPETGEWAAPTVCFLNNAPVLRKYWSKTKPKKNDVVVFAEMPMGGGGGGGSNPLRLIFTVGLAAVAGFAGAAIAGALFGGSLIAQGLITGAIMMLGSALGGAIFKTPALPSGQIGASQAQEADPTYSIGPQNNASRLGQPIPNLFGRVKIIPDRATVPYYKYIGNEQYLHQVFLLSEGLVDVESMAFGDTEFWNKSGGVSSSYSVSVQFCKPGDAVTLFPDNVDASVEVAGQRIFAPNEDDYNGPLIFTANSPGTITDRIALNLVFPSGIGAYNNKGELIDLTISFLIQYRRIDDSDNPLSGWSTLYQKDLKMATPTAQRITVEQAVTQGRYQISLERTNDVENNGRTLHVMQWESLLAYLPGTITYDQSVVALRIRATNLLTQQAASTFSVILTRVLPTWDIQNQTWRAAAPTRNFAAALSFVARWHFGARLPDNRIDLDALWTIGNKLEAKGWTFDGYVSGAYLVWGLIQEMCAPFGVIPRLSGGSRGGVLTFIEDQANRPVRHIFTPQNIIRGTLSTTWRPFSKDTPDDVMMTYLDEAAGFQSRDVRAALPGSASENPALKSVIGPVKRQQAFEIGIRFAAQNVHRRIEHKFQTEMVGRLFSIGEVIDIEHPFFMGMRSGEVKGWNEDELSIALDASGAFEDGAAAMYLSLNLTNGDVWGPCLASALDADAIKLDAHDYAVLLSQGQANPFEKISNGQDHFPSVWVLRSSKTVSHRAIITGISPVDAHHFEISAINDNPEAYGYQGLTAPPHQYRPNGSTTPGQLTAPAEIKVTAQGTKERPTLVVTWLPVPGANSYAVKYETGDNGNFISAGTVSINSISLSVPQGAVSFDIAGKNEITTGPSGTWEGNTDDLFIVAPVLRQAGEYAGGVLNVEWDAVPNANFYTLTVINTATNSVLRSVELAQGIASFQYSLSMGAEDGGPYRALTVRLAAMMINGPSASVELNAVDAPPSMPTDFEVDITASSVTLESAVISDENTGLVVVRGNGPDFGLEDIVEVRTANALPYAWSGLSPATTYWFRIAAKDAIYDLKPNNLELNYTAVLEVLTASGEATDG